MKQIVVNVEDDLHREFKEWCARNEVTMKNLLTEFITETIKEDKK